MEGDDDDNDYYNEDDGRDDCFFDGYNDGDDDHQNAEGHDDANGHMTVLIIKLGRNWGAHGHYWGSTTCSRKNQRWALSCWHDGCT